METLWQDLRYAFRILRNARNERAAQTRRRELNFCTDYRTLKVLRRASRPQRARSVNWTARVDLLDRSSQLAMLRRAGHSRSQ